MPLGPLYAADLPAPVTAANFLEVDYDKAKIGQLLFYDKILSGNRNIACVTCHHPKFGSSDGLSLGVGEGGNGIGPDRTPGEGNERILKRIPRNAQGLWNLGAKEVSVVFHDGRLSVDDIYENGFNSPAEEWLPSGLDSILAAQSIFPLTSMAEMAGSKGENQVAGAVNDRIDLGWPIIAKRVRIIPEYGSAFVSAFDHITAPEEVTIVEIANALAAFMTLEFQSFDSPFDRYLAGNRTALSGQQLQGMELFFGTANCATCHSGQFLSDQEFHALALPPFGPGRTRRFDPAVRDVGRMGESDDLEDAYRFRTPMLRNASLTAPYGHNGAYPTLRRMVEHHVDPMQELQQWSPRDANLISVPWLAAADFVVQDDRLEMDRLERHLDIEPIELSDAEIDALVAFLEALTGTDSVTSPVFGSPTAVPSGLLEM
ncbi:MAG: cytochrome c peroxidase [Paracoccaceae bacterium]|nr:cytochrome c peroxidase [Paracoccaceae bacterium]